ncbi:hypothetical protein KP509_09G030500 [Ceratopteris richardii]|uniref:Uncharacterized protein n=1 Tax=Ceratopteris richardii TaxID=49495 RepID=A0A8T2U5B5_CERRI|nr:hypothetical protein KP509_09G030500 [Ceratopteris richardii]
MSVLPLTLPPASGNSPVSGTPPDFTPPSSGSSPVGETPTPPTYVPPSSGSSPDVETPPLSPPYSGSPASGSSPLVGSPLSSPLGGSPISSPDVGSPLTSPTPFVPTPTSPSGGSGGYGGKGSCGFWSHHDLKFPSILSALTSVGKVFGGPALNIFGSQMTLMKALVNSNQDDYSNLARQGTASLLNSYAYAGEFSLTPEQVLDGFNKALDSPESALQQAALFERANNALP